MAFYQAENSIGGFHYDGRRYADFSFAPHLHRHPEAVLLLSGELTVVVEGLEETMTAGDAALIMPNQIHAYHTPCHSASAIAVFSGDYVNDFLSETKGKCGDRSVFHPDEGQFRFILHSLESGYYERRAGLYALCACYLAQIPLSRETARDDELIHRVLSEVALHFDERITLAQIADDMGYDRHYLSRCFHKAVKMNFRQLINYYRLDRARSLITETEMSFEEIARLCGFSGIRPFDRAFLELTGSAPSRLRRKKG